jgi:MoxR-like ATPase
MTDPHAQLSTQPTGHTMTPEEAASMLKAIEDQVTGVIVGQRDLIRSVMLCLLAEGHALVEGVPGLGKTELLKALGKACGLHYARIQFTPDLMPADIVGTQVLDETTDGRRVFNFRPGPLFAGFVLADEINRATPKTQSALLEAMAERTITVAGSTRPLPRPFLVMATQNPIEMDGTYPLPEAQLDRFMLKALVPFPSATDMLDILARTTVGQRKSVAAVSTPERLQEAVSLARAVPVTMHLGQHIVDLVMATQPNSPQAPEMIGRYVRVGGSPRAAQSMMLAAKASALLDGRPNVRVEDIRSVAPAVLRHRLVTGYQATADGVSADDLVAAVLDKIPVPAAAVRGT